jgi:hypothetical protein
MITPTEFSKATPRMKSAMVQDGLEHLNINMARTIVEIRKLNTWLEQMPRYLETKEADPVDGEQIADVLADFQLKVDLFNEQCIINSERITKLAEYIKATQPQTNCL